MSANLPQLRTAFRALPGRGFCTHGRQPHKATLKGLAADGTWRTAPGKQYMSLMCRTISDAVSGHIVENENQPHLGDICDLPTGTLPLYAPLDPYDPDQVLGAFGQDFASQLGSRSQRKDRASKAKPWLQPTVFCCHSNDESSRSVAAYCCSECACSRSQRGATEPHYR